MADVRLVHRESGSVLVVPKEKAAGSGLRTMGYEPEKPAAKKATTKKSSK